MDEGMMLGNSTYFNDSVSVKTKNLLKVEITNSECPQVSVTP
jgi:hypothetical protein